jgi:hypothetical protein
MPDFTFKPDWAEDIVNTMDRRAFELDAQSGPIEITDVGERTVVGQRMGLKLFGRAQVYAFRQFLDACRGRAVSFMLPSFTAGIEPIATIAAGTTFDAKRAGFAAFMPTPQLARTQIRIERHSGDPLVRTLIGVEEFSTYERFTVSEALPVITLDNIRRVIFMVRSRLDQDAVELKHEVDDSAAVTTALVTASVPEPTQPEDLQNLVWDTETGWTLSSGGTVASINNQTASQEVYVENYKAAGWHYAEAILSLGSAQDCDLHVGFDLTSGASNVYIRWTRGAGYNIGGGVAAPASFVSGCVIGYSINVDAGIGRIYLDNVLSATLSWTPGPQARFGARTDNDGVQHGLTLPPSLTYPPPNGETIWTL